MGGKLWRTTFIVLLISVIVCLAQPEEQSGATGSAADSKTINNEVDSKSAAPNKHHGSHGGGNLLGAAIGAGAGLVLLDAVSNYGYQPAYYDPYYSGYGYRPGHHHSGYYFRALPLQQLRPIAEPELRTQDQSAVNGPEKSVAKTEDSANTGAPLDQPTNEAAANPGQIIFVPVIYTPNPVYPYQTYPYLNDGAQQRNAVAPKDNNNPNSRNVLGTALGTAAGIVLASALDSIYDPYYPPYDPYYDPYYDDDDDYYRTLPAKAKITSAPKAAVLPAATPATKKVAKTRKKRSAKPLHFTSYPARVIGYQDTVVGYEDTVVGYQDTVVGYQDTVYVPPAVVVTHDYPDYY